MSAGASQLVPSQKLFRFLAVGLGNTLAGLLVIYAAKGFFGVGDVVANVCGYAVGLTLSFILNKTWTFRHRGDFVISAVRFLLSFAVSYALNLATVLGAIHLLDINSYLAQALGIPPYTIAFYLLSKHFAFRKSAGD